MPSAEVFAAITAGATVALVAATLALAWLTWILAKSSHRPFVVATMDVNPSSSPYVDLNIRNEGNASAFDVEVTLDPPLPESTKRLGKVFPPSRISVVAAGQQLSLSLCEASYLFDVQYIISISWRNNARFKRRHSIQYPLDISHLKSHRTRGINPAFASAAELKKIRESVDRLVSGQQRLQVDQYCQADRSQEMAEPEPWEEPIAPRLSTDET